MKGCRQLFCERLRHTLLLKKKASSTALSGHEFLHPILKFSLSYCPFLPFSTLDSVMNVYGESIFFPKTLAALRDYQKFCVEVSCYFCCLCTHRKDFMRKIITFYGFSMHMNILSKLSQFNSVKHYSSFYH